jgi:hypothetical protein
MALSPTTTSLCNSLDQKFDPLVGPAEGSESGFKSQMRDFISALRGASFSPQSLIDSTLATLWSDVGAILPESSLDGMTDLKNFIEHCTFLDSNPVTALNGSTNGIFDKIDEYINNIALPEFGLGAMANRMNQLLETNKISDSLIRADRLLDCITQLCPGFDPGPKYVILGNLFDQYKLISDPLNPNYGGIDYDTVYTSAGLTTTQKTGMNTVVNGITSIKQNALTSVNNAITSVKNLIKTGGFF